MTAARAASLAALCVAACVSSEREVEPGVVSYDEGPANVVQAVAPDSGGDDTTDDICSLLPADGPCALACDEGALADTYVPPGTCVAFGCTLTDGRMISVHACHPGA